MATADYAALVATVRAQQSAQPLSILALAEPIAASQADSSAQTRPEPESSRSRPSDGTSQATISEADASSLTPDALFADLAHYKDLFSKLRFSYLEQVTKEKYLRSIVGDPPLVVSHGDNLALEEKLSVMKTDLKSKKVEVDAYVMRMEDLAKELAERYESVSRSLQTLERVPAELETLRQQVHEMEDELATRTDAQPASENPRMTLSLEATREALEERQQQNAEIDRQIEMLQRQMPAKDREVMKMDRDLAELEKQRNESTRLAVEGRRRKEMGGRDEMDEMGRWYRGSETVLKGLLGVQG